MECKNKNGITTIKLSEVKNQEIIELLKQLKTTYKSSSIKKMVTILQLYGSHLKENNIAAGLELEKIILTKNKRAPKDSKEIEILSVYNTITKTKSGKYVEGIVTKTQNGIRKIPLTNDAIELIEYLVYKFQLENDDFLFGTINKLRFIEPPFYRKAIKYYSDKLELSVEYLHAHMCRHTFASYLLKENVDIKVISKLLGHANTEITYNTYIHILEEQKLVAITAFERLNLLNSPDVNHSVLDKLLEANIIIEEIEAGLLGYETSGGLIATIRYPDKIKANNQIWSGADIYKDFYKLSMNE